ncbi:MAG: DUF1761 domain-containing protein [Patescibacteria group bacterium]|nr:DUF1761 domain-containing protein [Patescibacteria group bacterium]
MGYVNYLAILVGALASIAIGWLWYSPALFGKQWMRATGMGELTPEKKAEGMKKMPKALVGSIIAQLVLAYVMSYFAQMMGVATSYGAIELAIWAWLGFAAVALVHPVLWEGKSWSYFAIVSGYSLVSFVVVALIVTLWV